MFLSKFLIIVALNFLATTSALANNNLTPLESYIKKNPLWIQNFDDVAYISIRCSALYAILGGAFIELGRNDDDKKIGDAVLNRGRALMNIGVTSSVKFGWDEKSIIQRFRNISDLYTMEINLNRITHNTMLHGNTKEDFIICNAFEKKMAN